MAGRAKKQQQQQQRQNNSTGHKANLIRAYEYNIFLNSILHCMQLSSYEKEMYPDFQL